MHLFLALLLTHPSPVPLPPSRFLDTTRTQDGILLRVLAINDLHGALEPQTWPGDGAAAVKRVLPQARAAASFVIVVAHEGAFCDAGGDAAARPLAATACHGEILDLARRLDSGSVDLIVSGHTHSLVNTVVNGIPVVQARSSGAGIAVVDFVRGPGGRREVP